MEEKIPYFKSGTWIAIEVNGTWFPCLVARKNRSASLILLYIFSAQESLPSIDHLEEKTAGDSLSIIQTGMRDAWRIIGPQPGFNPAEWPIPPFSHTTDELTLPNGEVIKPMAFLREYDDKLNLLEGCTRIPLEEAHHYYKDGLKGPLLAERYISELNELGLETRGEKWRRDHLKHKARV